MARATIAQAKVHLKDWVRYMHDGMLTNWSGITAQIRTALGNLETDRPRAIGAGIMANRQAAWQAGAAEGANWIEEMARSSAVNMPSAIVTGPRPLRNTFAWLRDYFADEGAFAGGSVDTYWTSRDFTRGSISNVTGTRTYRTTTDKRGLARQNGHPDSFRLKVESGGGESTKRVLITGLPRGDEPFEYLGCGGALRITLFNVNAPTGGGTTQILENPVLLTDSQTDGAAVATMNGWTLPGTVSWIVESTAADLFGSQVSVLKSVGTTVANHTLTQAITKAISADHPFLVGCWVRNSGSFVGSMQVQWGDVSQSWSESSFSGTDWTPLVADLDKDLFLVNFDEDNCDFVFSLPTMTSGAMELGSVFMIEMVEMPGSGSHFASLADDTGPINEATGTLATDSIGGSEGDYAQTIAYVYDEYLPGAGTNLESEPT